MLGSSLGVPTPGGSVVHRRDTLILRVRSKNDGPSGALRCGVAERVRDERGVSDHTGQSLPVHAAQFR
ncbi:MAG: hypothetical protein DI536_19615 [Archangium gephyra]|uniref:Uncharacterized protein n=1 Tax=Archangium gephyra TaxID=48 RepID=A0A2W5V408_9BACT|nr:MAG: hypothetical protein DI536_19615 [Archangium gephyra]